ncbi:bifunctional 5,10-methylenetetrahydrofolate dehydrogenase/5,10-methenyltetrahydrofolate cyclohydrolase [Carboxydothermus hydrogenoformans]|uniref:Bifunctional protein FolD n=1 Tax=Carboxydothermus hydrogenoformans (strain ATCC BAA-161 / DSM 6008 / Z-2901) TaxID=246194 RepID=FOLD_CARHZ|nr:bifunctional 5,10-methylenetetrahydrofolate dehydrogenase/5,10-methenyltetrahydrofolate cyclohydrolase [Carboxydothermus hydrogenoformans]Q3AAY6.1 RecName: Full=Bifunctional protein FolD; Includes: RecName: Full=Methylenetetrahydrofolate dehydrogenase; Includes: RecName: Full=Methenyltetrahydrofolate cyclohydrolase [Carboxydothermus hydrogenoformans Z-2901]ABB15843.1 methylenetetrahydrofolate dehydrogenase/methenyltetrahydrofolate cyclohydrolase [Carboxydothermus hydrogenoformans Z-2901]
MAERLTGKPVADAIKEELKGRVADLKAKGIVPKLGIVRVGARPDDLYYEGGAKKTCESIGMDYEVFEYPQDIDQESFEKAIIEIGAKKDIHGILMFSPLPKHLNERKIRSLIPVEKDVDSLTLGSAGKVFADDPTGFPPCTPTAVMEILKYYNIPLEGKRAVVLGRSLVVGKPAAILLLRENATVTICHSRTKNLPDVCREADILVAAVGRAKMVKEDYVKPGMVVIDVGINEDPDNPGKYCGDVDFDKVEPIVDKITPVPGGVGSVTTAVLCKHTVKACEILNGLV